MNIAYYNILEIPPPSDEAGVGRNEGDVSG